MKDFTPKFHFNIWQLALGYFAFYVPYSSMTKGLSKGLFFNIPTTISGFELLPVVLIGTVLGFISILIATGWWKQAGKVQLFGKKIPFASNKLTFFSGLATAVIIATTTLAYSFTGISIVFAALLMRGGVLLMAPFIDVVYRRKIQWYSWLAFGLTLFSLLIVFSEKAGYNLSIAAGINIGAYLCGYFFRLQFMTYSSKTDDVSSNYKFFVEEMLSASFFILFIPIVLAFIGQGEFMMSIRAGYTTAISSGFLFPALVIGFLYSCLYIFGSRIYIDKRENTFCIPINRCASLLAGMTSAIILSLFFEGTFYSITQLVGAVVLLLAIVALSAPRLIEMMRKVAGTNNRVFLFVCPGNTGRSPMAQAICMDRIVKHLETKKAKSRSRIEVMSAGITGDPGRPISEEAILALESIGVPAISHTSQKISRELIQKVDQIWCISSEHKELILEEFPEAKRKINAMNSSTPNPHGKGLAAYIECAQNLEQIIDRLILKREIQF